MQFTIVDDEKKLKVMCEHLRSEGVFAIDTETTGLHLIKSRIIMIPITCRDQHWVLPIRMKTQQNIDIVFVRKYLEPLLKDKKIVKYLWNAKYDRHMLYNDNMKLNNTRDIMVAAWLLDENRPKGLKVRCQDVGLSLSKFPFKEYFKLRAAYERTYEGNERILTDPGLCPKRADFAERDDWVAAREQWREDKQAFRQWNKDFKPLKPGDMIKLEMLESDMLAYAYEDTLATWALAMEYLSQLEREPRLYKLFLKVWNPFLIVLFKMERRGQCINMHMLEKIREQCLKKIDECCQKVYGLAGRIFSIGSPQQMSEVLYDDMGCPVLATTNKGAPSTGADTLTLLSRIPRNDQYPFGHERFQAMYPITTAILEWRNYSKLYGTYLAPESSLGRSLHKGRIHGSYNGCGTGTGRLSCVASWTPVLTKRGYVPISEIVVGDMVFTHKGRWRRVSRTIIKGVDEMFNVRFSNGEVLTCTNDHRLLVSGKWTRLGDINHDNFTQVVRESKQHTGSAQALQGSSGFKSRTDSGKAANLYSECYSRSQEQHDRTRIYDAQESQVFTVEDRGSKPHEKEDWEETSQLQGRVLGWSGVPNCEDERGETVICASVSNGEIAGIEKASEESRRTPHRRGYGEQFSGQPCGGDEQGSSKDSCFADGGFRDCSIEKADSCGFHQVFDITVEEDHSYLACGVFNHNSSEPNMQNFPRNGPANFFMRNMFIPPVGYRYLVADYSQIELRVIADKTGDKNLVAAYNNDEDIHHKTATGCGLDPEKERSIAKGLNFGAMYGIGDSKFGHMLTVSTGKLVTAQDAERYLDAFFQLYSKVPVYQKQVARRTRENGFTTTYLGRKRRLPDIHSPNTYERSRAERQAFNAEIQGGVADIMNICMLTFDRDPWMNEHGIQMVGQVHDEVHFIVPMHVDFKEVISRIKAIFEKPFKNKTFKVPIKFSCPDVPADTWGEAK